jgi:hypothetical protein
MRRLAAYAAIAGLCHCGGPAFTSDVGLALPEAGPEAAADEGARTDATGGGWSGSIGAEPPDREEAGGGKHRDAGSTSASGGGSGGGTTRGSSGGAVSSSGGTGIGTTGGATSSTTGSGTTGRGTSTTSGGTTGAGVIDAGVHLADAGGDAISGPLWPGPNDPNTCSGSPDSPGSCNTALCSPYGAKTLCAYGTYCACDFFETPGLNYQETVTFCAAQCRRSGWKTVGVNTLPRICTCSNDCANLDCDAGL